MDSYANASGFDLVAEDQVACNLFIAGETHARGRAVGLRNALELMPELFGSFDFAVNDECDLLAPFIVAGKAVFTVEYKREYVDDARKCAELCTVSIDKGFSALVLPLLLVDSFWYGCSLFLQEFMVIGESSFSKRSLTMQFLKRLFPALVCIIFSACVSVGESKFTDNSKIIPVSNCADGVNPGDRSTADCESLPTRGALNGERFRVLITTDLPTDSDDIQSLMHFLLVADLFDVEGIVSAPPTFNRTRETVQRECGSKSKTACIQKALNYYEQDYPNLATWSDSYPKPDELRKLVKQGHEQAWKYTDKEETEGSRWLVVQALKSDDERPLYILAWGAITNTATALLHHPEIADRIRVFMVGWSNVNKDQQAYDYIQNKFPQLFFVEAEGAMFGVRFPEHGEYDNRTLCDTIERQGAMGKYWCESRREYVDQDFVSVYYLLAGDPENPASEHWGGRYQRSVGNRWVDVDDPGMRMSIPDLGTFNGVKTSSRWRTPRMEHLLRLFERTAAPKE